MSLVRRSASGRRCRQIKKEKSRERDRTSSVAEVKRSRDTRTKSPCFDYGTENRALFIRAGWFYTIARSDFSFFFFARGIFTRATYVDFQRTVRERNVGNLGRVTAGGLRRECADNASALSARYGEGAHACSSIFHNSPLAKPIRFCISRPYSTVSVRVSRCKRYKHTTGYGEIKRCESRNGARGRIGPLPTMLK